MPGKQMNVPPELEKCIKFHGHMCPGLAIGFAASKIAKEELGLSPSVDEEVVAIVENDSCSVDAVQVMTGCTFGKGNFFFRDWGKQVFTFYNRDSKDAVRVAFTGGIPYRTERHDLKKQIDAGTASEEVKKKFDDLGANASLEIISEPKKFFKVEHIKIEEPERARIVDTANCDMCGEPTMTTKVFESQGKQICRECESK